MFELTASSSTSFVFELPSPQHHNMKGSENHQQVHFSGASFASPLVGPCCVSDAGSTTHFVSPHCSVTSAGTRSLTSSIASAASSSDYSHGKRSRDFSESSSLDGGDCFLDAQAIPAECALPAMMLESSNTRQQEQPAQQSSAKKNRPNTYIAPRKVAHNFLAAMGSLAANSQQQRPAADSATMGFQRVPLRRQLSASKLDPFLSRHSHHGGSDSMMMMTMDDTNDMETEASRPRSMSF